MALNMPGYRVDEAQQLNELSQVKVAELLLVTIKDNIVK